MTALQYSAYDRLRGQLDAGQPRLPWLGRHLQTLRNTLLRPKVDLSMWPERAIDIAFEDGDHTRCFYHEPFAKTFKRQGCALLIHGLGGDANGTAIAYLARALLEAGWPVVRVNLRAAPMVSDIASGIAHAGKTDDLRDIFRGLEETLGRQAWFAVGISLGGNNLAKALGDHALTSFDVRAAMTVCAPIDMAQASQRILEPKNKLYERHLLASLKKAVTQSGMSQKWKDAARTAKTVYDFDDRVTGPFHGFGNADTYYARSSAGPYLKAITVPTLLLAAQDDPWIPIEGYSQFEGPPDAPAQILRTRKGGHVGFHFRGSAAPAYCAAAVAWFTAAAS